MGSLALEPMDALRWRSLALATVVIALSGFASPVAARASTIAFAGGVMTLTGTEGVNGLILNATSTCLVHPSPCVLVSSVPLSASADPLSSTAPECKSFGDGFMECDVPTKVVAHLGGADDRFDMGSLQGIESELYGGADDDSLFGGMSHDAIFGEDGDDYLGGNAGDDRLDGGDGDDALDSDLTEASRSAGADVYVGGPGAMDYVSYGPRRDALTVSLDGVANDGGAGELDDVGTDVEGIIGGWAADTLIGNDAANELSGGDGKDTLIGAGGDDTLAGGESDDRLLGGDGADHLEGGNSNDELDGGSGVDLFEGDDIGDPDCLFHPSMGCPSGTDTILARDGNSEYVGCGPGVDLAVVDVSDRVDDNVSTLNQCEQVDRGTIAASPPLPAPPPAAPPPPPAPVPPASTASVAPRLSGLSVAPLRRGRSTKVRYTLSAPASVTFRLERRARRNGRLRFTALPGSFRDSGEAGSNTVRFGGRLGGRRVGRGTYRLVAVARDGSGNASLPKRATLRVVS
jgi:hypothetical protein